MDKTYETPNLWMAFRQECPVLSSVPLLGAWCFKHFCIAYYMNKTPIHR